MLSRRRPLVDGRFNGIVAVTIPPDSLREFYARVAQSPEFSAALIRPDGIFLARFPSQGNAILRLKAGNAFETAIARQPDNGAYGATSQIDGIDRRVFYRKFPDTASTFRRVSPNPPCGGIGAPSWSAT